MIGFCIMYTYDVALDENWNDSYTANRGQDSDDGESIYVAGIREGCYKAFDTPTAAPMLAWCYLNGWTKPEEI